MTRLLALVRHPETPCAETASVSALARRDAASRLLLEYALEGDLAALRIPATTRPKRAHGLWQHTCFEAFIGVEDSDAYVEINLAPSGEWAAWTFDRYRSGQRDAAVPEPRFDILAGSASLALRAELDLAAVPWIAAAAIWRVGLAAVLESRSGALSYWALAHGPGRPDFHDAAGRKLALAAELPA